MRLHLAVQPMDLAVSVVTLPDSTRRKCTYFYRLSGPVLTSSMKSRIELDINAFDIELEVENVKQFS